MLRRAVQYPMAVVCLAGCLLAAEGVWLDVPFVRQEKNGCGAASVAMVMQYWQRQQGRTASVDPGLIHRAVYSGEAKGSYASDLERYLQQQGYRTFAFAGQWEDFRQHLQKGRPLMVALKAAGDLHYVVVTGLDEEKQLVMVNDPARRKLLRQDRADFEKQWKAAGNWTLLALPQAAP